MNQEQTQLTYSQLPLLRPLQRHGVGVLISESVIERVCFAGDLTYIIRVSLIVGCPVFLPDRDIAALLHFFGKCHPLLGPKGAKKEKKLDTKRMLSQVQVCVHMRTSPYNISQNLTGYGVFRKHPLLCKKVRGIYFN